jgi:competence protein ComEA
MKRIKVFDQWFLLSKAERNGAITLLFIVCFLLIVRLSLPVFFAPDKNKQYKFIDGIKQLETIQDSTVFKAKVEMRKNDSEKYSTVGKKTTTNVKRSMDKINENELFRFNPNQISFNELIKLGFSQSAAKNLINYRLKGGIFRNREDLRKIYGVDSSFFNTILPFIDIQVNSEIKVKLELNSADSSALTGLKGIGPVFASRICKFRNQLGGFVSIEQLKEVYQFPVETYNEIADLISIDSSKVNRLSINFAGINELKKHPYCKYENARKIIDFRSKKGYIRSLESLVNDTIIDPTTYKRLSPYLKVE